MNFVMNGKASGAVAAILMGAGFDPGALRPYIGNDGGSYITLNNQKLAANTAATLRKDEWIQLDTAVLKAAKERLNAVADLRSASLVYNIPNGMGKTMLEWEAQSDIGRASVSMDGMRKGPSDRPLYDLRSLPLPLIHRDFSYSARQVMASRNGGSPLDTTTAELAARRVAEEAERLLLGVSDAYTFGGASVYGYTNHPNRLTATLTAPSTSNQSTTLDEVLGMRQQSTDNHFYGPWMLYHSPAWARYMDGDYARSGGNNPSQTLRGRLAAIDGIRGVKQCDYLTGTQLILVQMTSDVARLVNGMEITTVQWETQGGMELNYKVMAILVPQLRTDFNNQCGIVHGSV